MVGQKLGDGRDPHVRGLRRNGPPREHADDVVRVVPVAGKYSPARVS